MHIISRKKLLEASREHRDAATQLEAWYRTAKSSQWKNLIDVRKVYSHADGVTVGDSIYTVFNICGNHYRLIAEIFYKDRTILVRHVLRHEEYAEGSWKK